MRLMYVCCAVLALLSMGCGRSITPSEIDSMTQMNTGWADDLVPFQRVLRQAALEHKAVFVGTGDTSSTQYRVLRNDSLGRLRLDQAGDKYSRWFATTSAQLKRLEGLITANRDWFRRLPDSGMSLLHARRSWDARREAFYSLYQSCKAQVELFPIYQASYDAFRPAPPVEVTPG
jgi:hypothetical protein